MSDIYITYGKRNGKTEELGMMLQRYLEFGEINGHDLRVVRLADFEKKSVPIPERPITYVVEPKPFEELMMDIINGSPSVQWREMLLRAAKDARNLGQSG